MDRTWSAAEVDRDFAQHLERHRGIVHKVANTYARLPEDRADLAQEIVAQLWRAWPGYDPARSLTTWMYRIALNVAISFVRSEERRRRHVESIEDTLVESEDPNATDHESAQHLRLLDTFIQRQAPLDRALLLLYMDDRQQREIGQILGLSESNVSTKISRLKQRIRDEL